MTAETIALTAPQLEIVWPDGRQESFDLGAAIIRVGRDRHNNEIVIPSDFKTISRNQFELRKEDLSYRLVSLSSATPTLVNDTIITNHLLANGDVISIGDPEANQQVRLTFVSQIAELLDQEFSQTEGTAGIFRTAATHPPDGQDHLEIQARDGDKVYYPMVEPFIMIGRDQTADIQIPTNYLFVSRQHAAIRKTDLGFEVRDLDSQNGVMVNGNRLRQGQAWTLHHNDIIRIGDEKFGASIGLRYIAAEHNETLVGYSQAIHQPQLVNLKTELLIGRDESCDIYLRTPKVSRQHAKLIVSGDQYVLQDLNSTNGTLVNGERISQHTIAEGDQIQIGDHVFIFQDGELHQFNSAGMRVDVVDLTKDIKTRAGMLRILDDIDLSVMPREFVAIVGGSGAGKTTLINALLGINPGDGQVLVNGHDFYKEYEAFRDQIGYVPQSDILHTALTVERALDYAIQLRLPQDTSKPEREQRIADVLETVSMNSTDIRQTRVRNLSGGQRKRVSIAAELLADPKLLYLDEPTSGLDPGLEKKMMYTLRRMADQGRTVILITHATANIVQVDHVAFLSQGQLVFFGPPKDALNFFEVNEFADIYERIDKQGAHWRETFTRTKRAFYDKFVAKRQENRQFLPIPERANKAAAGIRQFFRQLSVLTRRTFNIQSADLVTLGMLAALYPFTAILQLLISTPDVLTGNLAIMADPIAAAKILVESYAPLLDTRLFVFITGLEAVLIGMYVPSNELILERNIYLRERMVNLKVLPYLTSKVVMFSLFSFVQCLLYLVVLATRVDYPEQGVYFPAVVEIFITVFLTMASSVTIGLFVSSLARSPDMAMYVMVILLFFQFFFAGVIFDLRGKAIEPLQNFTSTHWAMVALGSTVDLPKFAESTIVCSDLPDNPATPEPGDAITDCRHYPEAVDDLQLTYGDQELAQAWGVLIAIGLLFYVLTGVSIWRLDKI